MCCARDIMIMRAKEVTSTRILSMSPLITDNQAQGLKTIRVFRPTADCRKQAAAFLLNISSNASGCFQLRKWIWASLGTGWKLAGWETAQDSQEWRSLVPESNTHFGGRWASEVSKSRCSRDLNKICCCCMQSAVGYYRIAP